MLAQSFMTHTELGVTAEEHTALIAVLGMLERGELVHDQRDSRGCHLQIPHGFSMAFAGTSCGTTACIGGWAAALMGINQSDYVNGRHSRGLRNLYWPGKIGWDAAPAQAAFALRSFLSTGKPNWAEAMA